MDARRRRGRAARAGPGMPAPPRQCSGQAEGRRYDHSPSAFEAVTRQMVEGVGDELREIRHRVDNLLWMVAGAILLDTALRVMGT